MMNLCYGEAVWLKDNKKWFLLRYYIKQEKPVLLFFTLWKF